MPTPSPGRARGRAETHRASPPGDASDATRLDATLGSRVSSGLSNSMKRPLFVLVVSLCGCGPKVEPPHLLYSQDAQSLSNPFPDARAVARPDFWKPFIPAKAANGPMRTLLGGYGAILAGTEGVGN